MRRCVYLDKDLVLPPMGTAGTTETFFVVASTDLQSSGTMTTRIREQLERVSDLKSKCTLTMTTVLVEIPLPRPNESLEQGVQTVADCVTQLILKSRERKPLRPEKRAKKSK
jgi:hypothetical protein